MSGATVEKSVDRGRLGQLLSIGFIVLNLSGLGFGVFLVYLSTIGQKPKVTLEEDARQELAAFEESLRQSPVMYKMDSISTNLEGVPRRLIKLDLSFEMLDAEGFEEVVKRGSIARSAVVQILNSKSYSDLESLQGKLHLKNQITSELNSLLERGVVKNIYFNEFVIQ